MSDAMWNAPWLYALTDEIEETASEPPEVCRYCLTPIWYGEAVHPCIWEHEYCNGRSAG